MKTIIFSYDGAPPERVQCRENLARELGAEIFVGGTDTVRNTRDLLERYQDDLMILEDDVSLCPDFRNLTDSVIQKYRNRVINFHFNTFPKGELVDSLSGLKIFEVTGSEYIWNQCFYVPDDVRKLIVSGYSDFCRKYPYYVRTKQQDVYIAYCIRETTFLAVYPSLVEHMKFSSTIREAKSKETIFKIGELK